MATYNLAKSKEKDLSDTHTEMRLKDQHTETPEVVTEKQLDKKDHEGETDVTTEKQLEKVRTGGADKIIEKNLSDSKGMFGKLRNEETAKGDINKLEEKRLSEKKTEDEKYSASSDTPKQVRWWDNLKKSNSSVTVKTAQTDVEEGHEFDPEVSFGRLKNVDPDEEGVDPDTDLSGRLDPAALAIEEQEGQKEFEAEEGQSMFVAKNKEGKAPMPHINMELTFDSEDFDDEMAIREAALAKVLEVRPNLAGKIDVDNFSSVLESGDESKIRLLLVGDEYFAPAEGMEESAPFTKIEHEEVDLGGTPMTVGKVTLGPQTEAMDEDALLQGVADYIADKIGLKVPTAAININTEKQEATFAYDPVTAGNPSGSKPPMAPLTPMEPEAAGTEDVAPEGEPEPETDLFGTEDEDLVPPRQPTSTEEVKPPSVAKSLYDFPIVVADAKGITPSKKK